jgi:hypothetical protein
LVDLVDAVVNGINKKYHFFDPSLDFPLTYRAITLWEHELAHQKALSKCKDMLIVKVLMDKESDVELNINQLKELRAYEFNLCLWVCFYGLMDFQADDFTIDILKKSNIDAKTLSLEILEKSVARKEEIIEVIKNNRGTIVAYIRHVLNVPLVNEAWRMTPLQFEYLILDSHRPDSRGVEVTKEMMERDPQRYKEQLMAMFNVGSRRDD